MRKILTPLLLATSILASAQAWTYSERFKTDTWNGNIDRDIAEVDCSTGKHEIRPMSQCFRKDVASGLSHGYMIESQMTNINGLNAKVARRVAASRPKRTKSNGTFKHSTGKAGTSYKYSTSQAHINWVRQKQAERQEAIRRAQAKKREEERRRRIEDNNRAAATTAAVNARLQRETDRRIESDYYNATEGAYLAQQRARQAHRTAGPQFQKNKTSNTDIARKLRGPNKPRQIMYPQRQPRNVARQPLGKVERKQLAPQQEIMLKRALMVRAELRRKNAAEKKWNEYKGIKLSDNAVSTLGKDWQSDDFKTGPLAPPPLSPRRPLYVEPKWLTKHKEMIELLGEPPLTSEDEIRLLKDHEFLGV